MALARQCRVLFLVGLKLTGRSPMQDTYHSLKLRSFSRLGRFETGRKGLFRLPTACVLVWEVAAADGGGGGSWALGKLLIQRAPPLSASGFPRQAESSPPSGEALNPLVVASSLVRLLPRYCVASVMVAPSNLLL